jgi:hypothetical protein
LNFFEATPVLLAPFRQVPGLNLLAVPLFSAGGKLENRGLSDDWSQSGVRPCSFAMGKVPDLIGAMALMSRMK